MKAIARMVCPKFKVSDFSSCFHCITDNGSGNASIRLLVVFASRDSSLFDSFGSVKNSGLLGGGGYIC
jgi:hypothetical protein